MKGSFKAKCVKSNQSWFTTGKIYEIKDGKITDDDREKYPLSNFLENIDQLKAYASSSEWELVTEKHYSGEYISIKRCKKNKRVTAIMSIDGKYQKSANVKLKDFDGDFVKAAKAAVDKLMDIGNTTEKAVKADGNFKAKVIATKDFGLTVGKVYEFVNGYSQWNDGTKMPQFDREGISIFRSFSDLIKWFGKGNSTKWEEVKEVETIPAKTFTRIVKQDKYEAGDKVKVREDLRVFDNINGQAITQSMMNLAGKTVTIKSSNKATSRDCLVYKIKEDNWYWIADCFEGKVIENTEPKTEVTPFDWSAFKSGKIAVHCDTEEKAMEFLKECDEQGIKWCTGTRTVEQESTRWRIFKQDTSYGCDSHGGIMYGTFDERVKINYTPSKPTVKEVKRPAKVGEWIKVIDRSGHYVDAGTIGKVTSLYGDGVYINGDVYGSGRLLLSINYVVLENYQPEDKPVDSKSEPEQPTSSSGMREVKREAKDGEYVKIVDASNIPETNGETEYKNGDVLKILKNNYGQVVYAEGQADNGKYRVLNSHEYVVLENYDYSLGYPKNEPFRKAKLGDKIKVVRVRNGHGPEVYNGDIMTVDEVHRDSVGANNPRDGHNWLDDKYQEYIIIEEAQAEPKAEDTKINIGDTVNVIGNGRVCTTYGKFIEMYAKDFCSKYSYGYTPKNGDIGVVIGKGRHETYGEDYLAVLANGKVFCIHPDGVEAVK